MYLDGKAINVVPGQTIWEAARRHGVSIPALCHDEQLTPVGACGLCVVEVEGFGPGVIWMTFHFVESPTNQLTNAALDPVAKIPEFKVSAVRVEPLAAD